MALSYWQSPCGLMAISADKQGITSIRFVSEPAAEATPSDLTQACCEQLDAYFDGHLTTFSVPLNPSGTAFQQQVWRQLQAIPYGQTVSYRAIANGIGKPTASRAVGMANGKNPLTIIVPCHRVIGSNGKLTGYAGGLTRKQFLLALEGAIQVTSRELGALLLLGAIWGASFIFMRVAAPEFGIVPLVVLRTSLATLVFLPFLFLTGGGRQMVKLWKPMCLLGAINTAVPFALFNFASLQLQSGVLAILNATAPMFAAMFAFIWLRERLSKLAIAGLMCGFVGVVVISLDKTLGSQLSIVPVLAVLGAAGCYGWGACMMKKSLAGVKPVAVAAGSQFWASLLLIPFALMQLPQAWPSSLAWMNALALALVGTGLAYLLYFYLIASAGPAKAVMVGYLVPLFGIAWGVIFLNEMLSVWDFCGGLLILLGISFTTGVAQRVAHWAKQRLVVN